MCACMCIFTFIHIYMIHSLINNWAQILTRKNFRHHWIHIFHLIFLRKDMSEIFPLTINWKKESIQTVLDGNIFHFMDIFSRRRKHFLASGNIFSSAEIIFSLMEIFWINGKIELPTTGKISANYYFGGEIISIGKNSFHFLNKWYF